MYWHSNGWGFMVDIYITSDEIKKYIFMIVLFNAVFPRILEQSGIMITEKIFVRLLMQNLQTGLSRQQL